MKLCLHDCTTPGWPAGSAVLEAIVHALRNSGAGRPQVCLATWSNKPRESSSALAPFMDSILELPAGPDNLPRVNSTLIAHGVDCFFSIPTPTALTVTLPQICWIYDFQHLHHPQNFSADECARRTAVFRDNAAKAQRIFVYSAAVERDLIAFAPDLASKVRRIQLVPHIPDGAWARDPEPLRQRNLPERFFFMPNQLQPHKNHERVLEALRILRGRGFAIPLVCTGGIPERDIPRRDALARLANELGVSDLLILLGFVPPRTYFQLMRHCVALINPSLFEGFGLGVCEAGYLARQIVASDIPAFREHGIPHALYFDPASAENMAARMEEAVARSRDVDDGAAAERHAAAQRRFATAFLRMLDESVCRPS